MSDHKKQFLSWWSIEGASRLLATEIKDRVEKPAGVIGIARGGLVPATIIAHKLGIRHILSIHTASYANEEKVGTPKLTARDRALFRQIKHSGRDWIVIDDICDSGDTIRLIKQYLPLAFTATLLCSEQAPIQPDLWYAFKAPEEWIVFPWEDTNA